MTEKAFECIICFEVCRKCINCNSCHQILCKKHVKKFRDDRCPSCRTSPFRYQENIALQRIIEQAFPKEEKLEKKKGAKKRKKEATSTAFTTSSDTAGAIEITEEETERSEGIVQPPATLLSSLEWAQESLLVFDDDPPTFDDDGIEPPPDIPQAYYTDMILDSLPTLRAAENVNTNTSAPPQTPGNDDRRASSSPYDIRDYGSKIRRLPPHEDEFRKVPNDAHLVTMKSHVRNCNHQGCKTVWKGPWGRFIGGDNGRDYFDLTRCREGKRLNKMIGWKYNDPRS